MTDRTIILDALIRVAVLFITAVLAPAVKAWIDRNAENREMQLVLQMASIAVRSVQDDLKTEEGQVRKAEALKRLAAQVDSWGIKGFTAQELDHYISTAYTEMIAEDPVPLPLVPPEPCPEQRPET